MEQLEKIVNNLSVDLYNEMLPHALDNIKIVHDKEYEMPEDWMYKTYPFLFE